MIYACQIAPKQYKLLNSFRAYPEPDKDTYYWYVSNFTPDMDKYQVILAIEKMFGIWQRGLDQIKPIGSYLHFKSTDDISKAHFIISFGSHVHKFKDNWGNEHTCPFNFDGKGKVLAHAWDLIIDKPYGGQIHMDDSENWGSLHSNNSTDILTALLHETGHALGLDHSQIRESIMYASYSGSKNRLAQDDIQGLSKRFGKIKKKVYNKYYQKETKRPRMSLKQLIQILLG